MTRAISGDCRKAMTEVRQWFAALPEGVAEMDIIDSHPYYDAVIEVRSVRNHEATPIQVGFVNGNFDIWAGAHGLTGYRCGEDSPTHYCDAIVTGHLVDVETILDDKVIASRSEVSLGTQTEGELWSRGLGLLSMLRRWRRARTQRHRYPPY